MLLLLGSCGGAPGQSPGGTGLGPVSGFSPGAGSERVIVNGVTYNVDNTIFVDAHGRTLDNLAIGMVVKVTAESIDDNPTSPTGIAKKMEVHRLVEGPMDDNSVSLGNNSFRVMGQTVFVNQTTVFDNVKDLLAIDNIVRQGKPPETEIDGSTDHAGFLRASYIRLWSDNILSGREIQLRGTARDLSPTAKTFAIGPLLQKVEYGAVTSVSTGLDNGVFASHHLMSQPEICAS